MLYAYDSAFPVPDEFRDSGLNKREYFAAMALQGLCASITTSRRDGLAEREGDCTAEARAAVALADALLVALDVDIEGNAR